MPSEGAGASGMKRRLLAAFAMLFCLPAVAVAANGADSGDTAWLLVATALVLFMTIPGLSLFYAGLVRSGNVLSILMQCFTITCIVSILWLIYGYSLAFSDGGAFHAWLGGLSNIWLNGVGRDSVSGTIPESVYVMFQMTFAIITPALVIGGFAERMKFSAVVIFTILWVTLVYIPVCHWVWGGGWLSELGLLDYAGGTVVHVTAGTAALVAALALGKRKGFPHTMILPHNLTMTVTGAGMLWVGWFGFNAGSAVAANGDAGMAMLVTHTSAATASLVWAALEWVKYGKPSALGIVTGMVAGLGAITPASGFVGPAGALIIGLSAGILCFFMTGFMKQALKIDDSLDVFPVHGVGGILGTILVSVFATQSWGGAGLVEGMTVGSQFQVQLIGVIAVLLWTAVISFIILKVTGMLVGGLRVSNEQEVQGLDINQHDEKGYNF